MKVVEFNETLKTIESFYLDVQKKTILLEQLGQKHIWKNFDREIKRVDKLKKKKKKRNKKPNRLEKNSKVRVDFNKHSTLASYLYLFIKLTI